MEATGSKRIREIVYEAMLAASVPGFLDADMRRAFMDEGKDFRLAELDMDSLARMEFCINLELSTGVTLLPQQLETFASTAVIEAWLGERLAPSQR